MSSSLRATEEIEPTALDVMHERAHEIAAVALWLCEDAPGFLTGQAIAVDGGAGA